MFSVANNSVEPVTLTLLDDDIHGNLNGKGTCATGGTIAVSGTYTCSFTATLAGDAEESEKDTVTAQAKDDENNTATDTDDATVTFLDVNPTIAVVKTACSDDHQRAGRPGHVSASSVQNNT